LIFRPCQAQPGRRRRLKRVILGAIVEEFDGRLLDRDTAVQALALVAFELNMVEIREQASAPAQSRSP
jgi:hypothetical protein